MPSPTYNIRLQLKNDLEENWKKIHNSFIPLLGEMIIYLPDDTHNYCRIKVGDGHSTLASLYFIDAATIDGHTIENTSITTVNRSSWNAGNMTSATVNNNTLQILNGTPPTLNFDNINIYTLSGDRI